MILKDSVSTRICAIPVGLQQCLQFLATCAISDEEEKALALALSALDEEIKVTPPPVMPLKVNVIITDRDEFTLSLTDKPEVLGQALRIALLPVGRWRDRSLRLSQMLTAALEELCHSVYLIDDETQVTYKVLDCYRHILPDVRMEQLYKLTYSE